MTANTKWEVDKLYSLGDRIVWGASGQTAIISEIATALDSAADMIDLPPPSAGHAANGLMVDVQSFDSPSGWSAPIGFGAFSAI